MRVVICNQCQIKLDEHDYDVSSDLLVSQDRLTRICRDTVRPKNKLTMVKSICLTYFI